MANPKLRLGRGLDNLIAAGGKSGPARPATPATPAPPAAPPAASPAEESTSAATPGGGEFQEIPIHRIDPSPYQPRREINPEQVAELAESIRSVGLLQPVLVRKRGDRYQLLAGERRWRACQSLQMKKIPARVTEAPDASAAVISLIENLQRENLNPVEEARGYASLIRDFDLTQEAVAERVGKSRPVVTNALRLLQLENEILGFLGKGLLSVGHAKVLLGVEAPEHRLLVARRVLEKGLSVRDTERLVHSLKNLPPAHGPQRPSPEAETAAIRDLEKQIALRLSTKVLLRHSPKRGRLIIEYYGNEDLQRILEKMGVS